MIIIVPKVFDISKANLLLDTYIKKREPIKALFVYDLINQQKYQAPKSILHQDNMIKKVYPKDLIESVLKDLGYNLLFYKSAEEFEKESESKANFSVIAFG